MNGSGDMKKKILIATLLVLAMLPTACIWAPASEKPVPQQTAVAPTCLAAPEGTGASVYANVQYHIDTCLNDGTEYAVYLAYPQQTAETYSYNSHQMRSASMIKVFLLEAAMYQVSQGNASLDEIMTLNGANMVGGSGILAGYGEGAQLTLREVLRLMITVSDNTATNMIIDRFGMDSLNAYIRSRGYNDTILQRKMMDYYAIDMGWENYSSVNDLGLYFNRVYNHQCVSYDLDELMLEFLFGQTDTDCFPAALPGRSIAHKTGALAGLYDDGGIIYQDGKDVILVIMTENYTGEYTAIQHMKYFAQAVAE